MVRIVASRTIIPDSNSVEFDGVVLMKTCIHYKANSHE